MGTKKSPTPSRSRRGKQPFVAHGSALGSLISPQVRTEDEQSFLALVALLGISRAEQLIAEERARANVITKRRSR